MFYDFNNFTGEAEPNTEINNKPVSQGGDRVPSRNYRSRGRVGVDSKD
jgi:hypothetical protein